MLRSSRATLRAIVQLSSSISTKIKQQVTTEIAKLSYRPRLAVLLVGSRPDSLCYIRHKKKAAETCGISFELINLSEGISQAALHRELTNLSSNPEVDGVLLQLPLPGHLHVRSSLFHIHPSKDVDGLSILNSGSLFLRDQVSLLNFLEFQLSHQTKGDHLFEDAIIMSTGEGYSDTLTRRLHEKNYLVPCAALSVRSILFSCLFQTKKMYPYVSASETRNLHVVIVNKSMVVGIPTAALLQKEGFIVTICGRNNSLDALQRIMKTADVVVTAYGQPEIFTADFFKKGAVIIDVGINEMPVEKCNNVNSSSTRRKLCGDVDTESVLEVASAIAPTPGGVGPLTVAYLMQNVLKASRLRRKEGSHIDNICSSFIKMYELDDTLQKSTLLPQHQSFSDVSEPKGNMDNSNFDV